MSTDGQSPDGRLARDEEGNLYGTATRGGLSDEGILFKVDRTGKETVLHTFTGPDGADPLFVDLIFDRAGNLYGTTSGGGTSGNGTVFKVDRTGALTTLYSFNAAPDGALPSGALVFDAEGNLYGTTKSGSNAVINGESGVGGTVFKLDKAGNETVLHNFSGTNGDGATPVVQIWGPIWLRDGVRTDASPTLKERTAGLHRGYLWVWKSTRASPRYRWYPARSTRSDRNPGIPQPRYNPHQTAEESHRNRDFPGFGESYAVWVRVRALCRYHQNQNLAFALPARAKPTEHR